MLTHAIIQTKTIREQLKNIGYDPVFIGLLDNPILRKLHEVHSILHPFFSKQQLKKLCADKNAIRKFDALLKYSHLLKDYPLSAATQHHLISKLDGIERLSEAVEITLKLAKQNFVGEFINHAFMKKGANLALNYLADNFDFFNQRFSEEEIVLLISHNDACPGLMTLHQYFDRLYPIFGTANMVKLASKTSHYLGMLTYLNCADKLSEKGFTFTEVLNILYVAESSKVLEVMLSEYDDLITLGLHHADIALIGQAPGAIQIYATLKEVYSILIEGGFGHSQILSFAAVQNGKLNLLAAKDAIESPFIKEMKISHDNLTSILANQHGAKNYQVFVHYHSQLTTLGFDLDQIMELFSNKNGSRAAVAILECSDDILASKVSVSVLLKVIKKESGITTLKEFLNLYGSLMSLNISPDFIYEKLSNKDYVGKLREYIESTELAKAMSLTQDPELPVDRPAPIPKKTDKTLKRKKGEAINYPKKRASVIVKRNKLLSTECVLAAYHLMQTFCPESISNDKRIIVKIDQSEASILFQVIKKERDKMGIIKIAKCKDYYNLAFNLELYIVWAADFEAKFGVVNTAESDEQLVTNTNNGNDASVVTYSYNGTLDGTLFAPLMDFSDADERFLDMLPAPPI